MNRRKFLNSLAVVPVVPLVTSTSFAKKDKYDDPDYGQWWKTVDSVFTVREIEMMCREWGWHHVEKFHKKYDYFDTPQHWVCQAGVGAFTGVDGNEYMTQNTFRTTWYETHPYDRKAKEKFKPFLKKIAGDYYWKGKREHYYFYDVLFPRNQYYVHDAYHDWDGKDIKDPSPESIEWHGKKIYNVILYHMGVTNGKMWSYIN